MSEVTLVTGGAGFIGSNLVRALLGRGARVRVLDNFSTGNRANLSKIEDDVEIVEGELRSYERVHAAVRGAETVHHLGALSVPRSVQDPLTVEANFVAASAADANGHVVNVATGRPTTVNELADTIGELLSRPVERQFLPARPGEIRDSSASVEAAGRLLGYRPAVDLRDGLVRAIDALRAR